MKKTELIQRLIEMETLKGVRATITMPYIYYLKELKLMLEIGNIELDNPDASKSNQEDIFNKTITSGNCEKLQHSDIHSQIKKEILKDYDTCDFCGIDNNKHNKKCRKDGKEVKHG